MKGSERILVAGGGIGGLTAAIALRRAGFEVVVFERAAALDAVGAGLLLAANAVKALDKLGLSDALREIGVPAAVGSILSRRGEVLLELNVSDLRTRVGADTSAVHRADLQEMLLREVDEAGATVWTGKELVGFEQTCDGVHAFFADETEERGAVLVGADGLRSRVRGRLFGDERPRYAGYTSWRGVAPESELVPVGGGFESWGRGRRFGCAHVGGGRVYWFATRNAPEVSAVTASRNRGSAAGWVKGYLARGVSRLARAGGTPDPGD